MKKIDLISGIIASTLMGGTIYFAYQESKNFNRAKEINLDKITYTIVTNENRNHFGLSKIIYTKDSSKVYSRITSDNNGDGKVDEHYQVLIAENGKYVGLKQGLFGPTGTIYMSPREITPLVQKEFDEVIRKYDSITKLD